MDGVQGRLRNSLQLRLSLALSLASVLIAAAAGLFSFHAAYGEAQELQDDVLRQVAALLQRRGVAAAPAGEAATDPAGNEESRVIVQRLDRAAAAPAATAAGAGLDLPASLPEGLQNHTSQGEEYRLVVRTTASGERWVVAQEAAFRDQIARDSALRAVMPLLILLPLLPLIAVLLVRSMFRPMAALSLEIDGRSEQELHPIRAEHLPDELRPFVVAINRLLTRVQRAMASQRRFVADAAHELRSPMTALSLQAERLAETPLSPTAAERLGALRRGIDRGRASLEQLLALARAQTALPQPASTVSVQGVYKRVLEGLMPLAEARRIDIGVEGSQDVWVKGEEIELVTLVKNLVDNAIRYTPEGGRVDISVWTTPAQRVALRVSDNGPGIAVEERSRVFDPFYRSLGATQTGSGLGLAIVKAIADRQGAELQLDFADPAGRRGLCVTVLLPVGA